ncbi:histidine biosynthesis bifunctional protein HisIE [Paraliobacillus ryukyuensis]|uniref:Histidine biosynthesis bifunctional protein HisIE n=1 Tax=Paraliobacillus ryukyuensis TaxID=200904 RepID=A0A366EH64_9BACI|nr:bifunctional phosphoribosyl-AMP cyclohydrolase/phosphoribosyl-ATP diphosphatase HisIE [Paraliobacillus ryukyuensis]RBP01673.1 phosphoribosyl-ATP pyrophosphatase /phosphoribosyl-AMP cyclohydrolase [Paraliobacillus ryukyuensis]
MKPDFSKGLLPAIIVDEASKEVLTLAYMNEESYQKTLDTKETWFYSRSRDELWHKGATSGNTQQVVSMTLDCDQDSLVVYVRPNGPACHTGAISCFHHTVYQDETINQSNQVDIIDQVMDEIDARKQEPVENSYTNYLFDKGIDKISKKVIEEAGEVVIAAKNQENQELVNEVSDLLYHTFVLMRNQGVSLEEVKEELANRSLTKGNSKGERPEIKKW